MVTVLEAVVVVTGGTDVTVLVLELPHPTRSQIIPAARRRLSTRRR